MSQVIEFPPTTITDIPGFLNLFEGKHIFAAINYKDKKDKPQHFYNSDQIESFNKGNRSVYFTLNELNPSLDPSKKRTAKMFVRARAVVLEDDNYRIEPRSRESFPIPYDMLVGSSKGHWHYYWFTSTTDGPMWTVLQKQIADSYDGDKSVCSCEQLLRLPFTFNRRRDSYQATLKVFSTKLHPFNDLLNAEWPEPRQAPSVPGKSKFNRLDLPNFSIEKTWQMIKDCPEKYAYDEGTWNAGLRMIALHHGENGSELAHDWSFRCEGKYDVSFTDKKYDYALGRDIPDKPQTLATMQMWINKAKKEKVLTPPEPLDPMLYTGVRPSYMFRSGNEINPAPIEWTIRNYIQRRTITCMFGDSQAKKSFIAIDMAVTIAAGLPTWFGEPVRFHGPVVYICGEGRAGIDNRFHAAAIEKDFHIKDLPIMISHMPTDFSNDEAIAKMIEGLDWTLQRFPDLPAMVIIDTLAANYSENVSESKDINRFYAALRNWMAGSNYTDMDVIFVAHSSHADKTRVAGSVQIGGNADQQIKVKFIEDLASDITFGKVKDGPSGASVRVNLKVVDLGMDDKYGDKTTTLVIDESCGFEPIEKSVAGAGLSRDEKTVLQGIRDGKNLRDIGKEIKKSHTAVSRWLTKRGRLALYVDKKRDGKFVLNEEGSSALSELSEIE